MKVFTQLNAQVIPLDRNNVDTDMIIPAQFLTKVNREGYGQHLFQRLREQDHDFVFNHARYRSAQILLTRQNFGCGSSREHAVWAIMQAGIKVIVAESYSDIFYNNALKNGLLVICLSSVMINEMLNQAAASNLILNIDLPRQMITTAEGIDFKFEYDPFFKDCLVKGRGDFDYLLENTDV